TSADYRARPARHALSIRRVSIDRVVRNRSAERDAGVLATVAVERFRVPLAAMPTNASTTNAWSTARFAHVAAIAAATHVTSDPVGPGMSGMTLFAAASQLAWDLVSDS